MKTRNIGKGIAVGLTAIASAWLEINGIHAEFMWFLIGAWILFGGSSE